MDIKNFFLRLLPNFERSRILEDIDSLRGEIKDNLLPALRETAKSLHGQKFKAKITQDFNGLFVHYLPQYRSAGFLQGLTTFFTRSLEKLDALETIVPEMFAADVTRETLTYRKAFVLQYLSALRMVSSYAAASLLRYVAAETHAALGEDDQIDSQLSPAEAKWLSANRDAFFQGLKTLDITTKEFGQAIESAADVTVMPDRAAAVQQTMGVDRVDPLRMGLIPMNDDNPIYFVRKVYAEWQVKQYQAKVEEKKNLELRLMRLKQAQSGQQNARLAQEIEYSEGRLKRLKYELQEMHDEYTQGGSHAGHKGL